MNCCPSCGSSDPRRIGTTYAVGMGCADNFHAGHLPLVDVAEFENNLASRVPSRPDSFGVAMAKVEELREARRDQLARRDRAEWDCFFHFACENSLFKRQAE